LRFTIKLGGSVLEDPRTRQHILGQVSGIAGEGHEIVLVHGGGKNLSRCLDQLGIASRFVDGLRVTDAATLRVAVMVLAGEVNKTIVAELAGLGTRAVGFCGADAAAVSCVPAKDPPGRDEKLGYVGRPVGINRDFFDLLLGHKLVPVVSSLALGEDFCLYNINADQMASVCAWSTDSQALVFLTDVPGVRSGNGEVLKEIGRKDIERLRGQGVIAGGMLPKTHSCLEALDRGVPAVYIVPGAGLDVLRRLVDGNLTEGTFIHGND
jgi:acetylglutamate kinase